MTDLIAIPSFCNISTEASLLIIFMSQRGELNPLLRRPLYIFDLPPELLLSLFPCASTQQLQPSIHEQSAEEIKDLRESTATPEEGVAPPTACNLCRVTYGNVQDQRQHVRSDLHRYNLKLAVKQQPAVDEQTFARLIGDLDESISGSSDSESEADEEKNGRDTTLSALLKRQAKLSRPTEEPLHHVSRKPAAGNAPMLWMQSPRIGNENVLGLYKGLLSHEEQARASTSLIDILKSKQLTSIQAKHSGNGVSTDPKPSNTRDPHYFLCMIGGGHFAAMVVSLVPEVRKGPGGVEERHAIVEAHKTFHRYTTRRKQGGSQSANDNAKGNAHSVGSSIRRANEAALEAEVRAILADWRAMIDTAELLFVRASGTTNRRTLFEPYDGQVLNSRDARLRGFPFSTRRATQAELLRSFQELTKLKLSTLVTVAPTEEPKAQPKPRAAKPKTESVQLSKEDETALLHTSQLQNLIRRSKAPGVMLYLSKNELAPDFNFFPPDEHHHAPSPLHLSASTNSPAIVTFLLTQAKADPTLKNGDGKTAYELAGDQKTRDAFRVARHQLGEKAMQWSAAHIPSGLTQQEADARAEAEKISEEAIEADRRKADLEHIKLLEEQRNVNRIEKKAGTGRSLAAAIQKTGEEKREEDARGLTPEQRTKLERERRARAAEARMKTMQAGR